MTIDADSNDRQTADPPRFGPPTTANPLWRVVVVSGAAFCLSCLLWITAGFGNPAAPGNAWLNRHGWVLIAVTGIASVAAAIWAMAVDGVQTSRLRADEEHRSQDAASKSGESQS